MVNKTVNKFDWFTKKKPTGTSENVPYAFSHIASGAPPSVYMSMVTGNTFDEAMQETNNIPMSPEEMDIDLAFDPELEDPDAIEKAIYQLRIAEEKEIEPEEVLQTPYGPGLSAEEIDLLLDTYPALDAGLDLDMIDENFDEVDRMLGKSGENIEAAMDAAEQRAEDEGDIGASPAMMRQLGDSLGTSVDAMLNPINSDEAQLGNSMHWPFLSGVADSIGGMLKNYVPPAVPPTDFTTLNPVFGKIWGGIKDVFGEGEYEGPPRDPQLLAEMEDAKRLQEEYDAVDPLSRSLSELMNPDFFDYIKYLDVPEQQQVYIPKEYVELMKIILKPEPDGTYLTPEEVLEEVSGLPEYTGNIGANTISNFVNALTSKGAEGGTPFERYVSQYRGGTSDSINVDAIEDLKTALTEYGITEGKGTGATSRARDVLNIETLDAVDAVAKWRKENPTIEKSLSIPQVLDQIAIKEWLEKNRGSAHYTDAQVLVAIEEDDATTLKTEITNKFNADLKKKFGDDYILTNSDLATLKKVLEDAEEANEVAKAKAVADITIAITTAEKTATGIEAATVTTDVLGEPGASAETFGVEDVFAAGTATAPEATELPGTPQGLMSENLLKTFYKTVYAYPEAGRSDVRARLPYIFSDTRTLYFLYNGEHAFADLDLLGKATTEKEREGLVVNMEQRYKSFLADYFTNPASLRTGSRFANRLNLVNNVLDYVSKNPDREEWIDPVEGTQAKLGISLVDFTAINLWVSDLFGTGAGTAGSTFAKANRSNLIKIAATQGGRGYYSGLIHSAVDRVMNYYKTIGWSEERIFKFMVEVTSAPTTDPNRMSPVELKAQQIDQQEKEKKKEAVDAAAFAETQLGEGELPGATDVTDPDYLANLAASQATVDEIEAANKLLEIEAEKKLLAEAAGPPPPPPAGPPPPPPAGPPGPRIYPDPIIPTDPAYLDLESGAGAGLAGYADQRLQAPGRFEGVPSGYGMAVGSILPGPEEQDYIDSILRGEDLRPPIITGLSPQERARRLQEQFLLAQKRTSFPSPVRQFGDFIPTGRGQRYPNAIL